MSWAGFEPVGTIATSIYVGKVIYGSECGDTGRCAGREETKRVPRFNAAQAWRNAAKTAVLPGEDPGNVSGAVDQYKGDIEARNGIEEDLAKNAAASLPGGWSLADEPSGCSGEIRGCESRPSRMPISFAKMSKPA